MENLQVVECCHYLQVWFGYLDSMKYVDSSKCLMTAHLGASALIENINATSQLRYHISIQTG